MLEETENKILQNLIPTITRYLIGYIKYFFLTGSVFFSSAVLIFIILNKNPDFSFEFIKYFSFLNPAYATGSFSMGLGDIMQIFAVISFAVMIIGNLFKMLLMSLFNSELSVSVKSKMVILFVIITAAYVVASVIVARNNAMSSGFYYVFGVFYILNLGFAACYLLVDILYKKIPISLREAQDKASHLSSKGGFRAQICYYKHMKVEHLTDQGSGKLNEDAILIGNSRFGVFDGAGSLDGYTDNEEKTGGYLASHIAEVAFRNESSTLAQAAAGANEKIKATMAEKGIDTNRKESVWCTTLAVVDIDLDRKEFQWEQITDALILLIRTDGSYIMLINDDYDHDKELLTKWKKLATIGGADIRSQLGDDKLALRRTQNVKYGVLNGELGALKFLRSGSSSLDDVAHILLFTDGFFIPKEDPQAEDDFETMTKIFLESGLEGVRRHVRDVENRDPQCVRYPRYKKHDDIAAIAISFS